MRGGPWALGAGRRVPDAGTRGPDAPVTGIPHGNNARVIAMLPVGRALKVSGGRRGRRRARAGRRGRRRMAGSGRSGISIPEMPPLDGVQVPNDTNVVVAHRPFKGCVQLLGPFEAGFGGSVLESEGKLLDDGYQDACNSMRTHDLGSRDDNEVVVAPLSEIYALFLFFPLRYSFIHHPRSN